MLRKITADLYQIGECVVGIDGHEAVRVYVLLNNGRPILIDCGSQLHRSEIMAELDTLLDGGAPENIFLTHSELPHSGNLQKIITKWPTIQVLVSSFMLKYIEIAPILPLEQITPVLPGTSLDVAGRKLVFINALLKDQPGTQWIYDPTTGALFTSDGFGYYHPATQCELFADEVAGGVPAAHFRNYHRQVFRYLRWVVPEKLNVGLDNLFQSFDIRVVAPTHGNAIRAEIPEHLVRLKRTLTDINQEYKTARGD